MVGDRPWVRRELPWLRSGPLYRVDVAAEADLTAFLSRFDYLRVELHGSRMTSLEAAHDELARAFDFPEYYGRNWDAFNDSSGDYYRQHARRRLAIIWRDLQAISTAAPATAAEVGWALLSMQRSVLPSPHPGEDWHVTTEVFAVGSGNDFDRP